MLTGQLIWTDPSDLASQLPARGNVANGDGSEAAFALLYTEVLGLSSELRRSEMGATGNGLDINIDDQGGLATEDYGGPRATPDDALGTPVEETWHSLLLGYRPIPMSSGVGERHFTATDRDTEANPGHLRAPYYSSSMSRFMSQNKTAQGEPASYSELDPAQSLNRVGAYGNLALPTNSAAVLNKRELADWMDAHALSRSSHHCAMYCRLGMEAAGLSTEDRPRSGDAGDYGPFLLRHGAQVVPLNSYTPRVGDTVVFDKTGQHPHGHIEMYDGHQWVSDFMQHSFSPYRDTASTPPFTIYRLI